MKVRSKMYIEALKNCDSKEECTYLEPKMIKPNNNINNNNNNNLYEDKETIDKCYIKSKFSFKKKRETYMVQPPFS